MGTARWHWGGQALVLVIAGLAMSLVAVPTAQAARSEFYGVTQPFAQSVQDNEGMQTAKVRTDRFPLQWSKVEQSQGSFDWTFSDVGIGALAAHGIRSAPFVWGSPAWAGTGGVPRPPVSASARQAWQTFLKAAVARYGPGGTYWTTLYHQQFGAGATAYPITSWQIWNEPNLKAFYLGSTYQQKAQRYGTLVKISHDAIIAKDPKAQIVLAGIATKNDPNAYNFLKSLYAVSGIKSAFDAAAVHPYAASVDQVRSAVQQFRNVMTSHGDKGAQVWITEFAWGSGPTDSAGVNKGLSGQAQALTNTYKMFLSNRTPWNLQRVFWFLWRDPAPGDPYANGCSFCGTAGLFKHDGTQKPAYNAFAAFTLDSTRPTVTITGGPAQGSTTHDATPTFSFKSSEAGSTFQCHYDGKPFITCPSPYTPGTGLANGSHTFYVKAIDAAGNESTVKSRSFKVG
jgi:Glycosyl hydrolase catalytic core